MPPVAEQVVTPSEAPGRPEDPRWIETTARLALDEAKEYLRTFAAVAARPARFGQGWREGSLRVMGPIAFMSASAALLGLLKELLESGFDLPQSRRTLLAQVLRALAPYLYYGIVGLACHAVLRLITPTRRWSSSLAAALYAGAAMPTVSVVLGTLALVVLLRTGGAQISGQAINSNSEVLVMISCIPLIWFYVALARVLAGIHSARGWVAGLVVAGVAAVTMFLPRSIPIPVWHVHLTLQHGDQTSIGVDVRDS